MSDIFLLFKTLFCADWYYEYEFYIRDLLLFIDLKLSESFFYENCFFIDYGSDLFELMFDCFKEMFGVGDH